MYSRAIRFKDAVLSYDVHGQGSRALLMFHGAGQDRTVFNRLPEALTNTYRIYAFDLFFHGKSEWKNDVISKQEWQQIVKEFFDAEQIGKIAVLGYSIGARFALAIVESFSRQVTDCFLVAPDGLINNPWFTIATSTKTGRKFFARLMRNPRGLHRLLQIGNHLGVMDPATMRFIGHQLDSEAKRLRVLRTWSSFRLLRFDLAELRRTIDSSGITVTVFLATRDHMVPEVPVRSFLKRLKSAHLEIIDSNHRRILNEALVRISLR